MNLELRPRVIQSIACSEVSLFQMKMVMRTGNLSGRLKFLILIHPGSLKLSERRRVKFRPTRNHLMKSG